MRTYSTTNYANYSLSVCCHIPHTVEPATLIHHIHPLTSKQYTRRYIPRPPGNHYPHRDNSQVCATSFIQALSSFQNILSSCTVALYSACQADIINCCTIIILTTLVANLARQLRQNSRPHSKKVAKGKPQKSGKTRSESVET